MPIATNPEKGDTKANVNSTFPMRIVKNQTT